MVVAFTNMCQQFSTVGHYLLGLLQYYGYTFQREHMMVAEGQWIVFREENGDELVVADLFKPETNAAASVTKFQEIQEMMRKTYEDIQSGNISSIFNSTE